MVPANCSVQRITPHGAIPGPELSKPMVWSAIYYNDRRCAERNRKLKKEISKQLDAELE